MAEEDIRVGLIGAGGNVRNRHIPGFNKVAGLEIIAVANRSLQSSQSVADQFNIPRGRTSFMPNIASNQIIQFLFSNKRQSRPKGMHRQAYARLDAEQREIEREMWRAAVARFTRPSA